jgi:hypothetical protein
VTALFNVHFLLTERRYRMIWINSQQPVVWKISSQYSLICNMSCQSLQRPVQYDHQGMNVFAADAVGVAPWSDLSSNYGNLNTAFTETQSLTEFKNRLMNNNPMSKKILDQSDLTASDINKNIRGLLSSNQTVNDKMNISSPIPNNSGIDNVRAAMNINDGSVMSPAVVSPYKNTGLTFPRAYDYNQLTENYDFADDLRREYENYNRQLRRNTGMTIPKLIILVILIILFIYGLYYLFGGGSKTTSNISVETNPSGSVTTSISKQLKKIFADSKIYN